MKLLIIFPKDSKSLLEGQSGVTFGGASVQMLAVAREAVALSHDALALAPVPVMVANQKLKTILLPAGKFASLAKLQVLIKIILSQPDYILQHGLTFGSLVIAIVAKIIGSRFVFMVAHDREASLCTQSNGKYVFYAKWTYKLSHQVIVQHDGQLRALAEHGIHHTKIMTLPLEIPSGLVRNANKNSVVWIARCESWKRPEWFIRFAQNHPHIPCVMICPPTDPRYFSQIKNEAEKISNLKFFGGVPYEETWNVINKSRFLANSSIDEGFPQTFVQAYALGVPVVTAGVDPNKSISEFGCGIKTTNEEDFQSAMLKMYDEYEDYTNEVNFYYKHIHSGKTSLSNLLKSFYE